MSDAIIVDPQTQDDPPLALVALTPAELPGQQAALAAWCDRKIDALQRELGTFVALTEEAAAGGFKHGTYQAGERRTERRIVYYRKIKAAIEAGYLIVPNMPTLTFAVRVNRAKPARNVSESQWSAERAEPQLLPAGEGRYVDKSNFTESETYQGTNYKNEPIEKVRYFATNYDDDIDFPLRGVMPTVLAATSRAMALRLFDQLGVVQNSGGRDPIVVGQLLDPRGNQRLTTFFVAWWLNTADL